MVTTADPSTRLVASWGGSSFLLWLRDEGAQARDIAEVSSIAIDRLLLDTLPRRTMVLPLAEAAQRATGNRQVECLDSATSGLISVLMTKELSPTWTPTIKWIHDAVSAAMQLVSSGRAAPLLNKTGLRWTATWQPILDTEAGDLIANLSASAPPAIFSTLEIPRLAQVLDIVSYIVDEVARQALRDARWRPDLDRSRAAVAVARRRVAGALYEQENDFVADSAAHEEAFAVWSNSLTRLVTAPERASGLSITGRLSAPSKGDLWNIELALEDSSGVRRPMTELWSDKAVDDDFYGPAGLAGTRFRVKRTMARLMGDVPPLRSALNVEKPTTVTIDSIAVSDILGTFLEMIESIGLDLQIPEGLDTQSARLTATASGRDFTGNLGLGQAFVEVDWSLALGGERLTEEEIREIAASQADVVAVRGQWVRIDREVLDATLASLEKRRSDASEMTPKQLLRESIELMKNDGSDDMAAEGWIASVLAGLPDEKLTETEEPAGFVGELRPYQKRALSWLHFLGRLSLGACLADDMGLGKTPTALAFLLSRQDARKEAGLGHKPHLVICPLSVVRNWEAESNRFTPSMRVGLIHGPDRARGDDLKEQAATHDILITTYGTASRMGDELSELEFDVTVCDEAQAIKNHRTNAAQALRLLNSEQLVALTGTPVENRLTELWSILDLLNPGMLGGVSWFRRTFATPIETNDDIGAQESLRSLTSPFILRRTKSDRSLVPDLPDKIEQVAWATLSVEQAGLYQALVDDFNQRLSTAVGMERRGLVLATLTKLKQVCNHPAHFLSEPSLGAAGRSGKLARFDELIDTMMLSDERAVVFTQYRQMGDLLSQHLSDHLGVPIPFLHGGTTIGKRSDMVDRFQSDEGPPVQIISLRAGGTGLNLTNASRVIHYDRWWNPAVEDQATDRTWRIGQTKTVFVHKLVCRGTLEERIDAMLEQKRGLADSVIKSDDAWVTEMSTDELKALVSLEIAEQSAEETW